MSMRIKRRNKKKRFMIVLLASLFILLFAGIAGGVSLFRYLAEFSRNAKNDPNAVKPHAAKSKNDPVNILVMGVDIGTAGASEENNARRTDTILLLNYNPKNKKVHIVSIPRDTLITINGKNQKINAAHAIGGVRYLVDAVEQLLDLKINYYGKVDYSGFRELIDIIGGVDMTIPNAMDYDDPAQDLHIHFNKGDYVHLDGKKAEEFFRWRKNNDGTGLATGDLGRIDNQHMFIETVMEKLKSVKIIPKVPGLLKAIPKFAETNMDGKSILRYGMEISKVKKQNIQMSTIQGDPVYIQGISYVIYDEAKNTELLSQLHDGKTLPLDRKKLSVQVLNGTHTNGLAGNFSSNLRNIGYGDVTPGNGNKTSKTTVTIYGVDKKYLSQIKKDLGTGNIIYDKDKKGKYDIVILLGDDFQDTVGKGASDENGSITYR